MSVNLLNFFLWFDTMWFEQQLVSGVQHKANRFQGRGRRLGGNTGGTTLTMADLLESMINDLKLEALKHQRDLVAMWNGRAGIAWIRNELAQAMHLYRSAIDHALEHEVYFKPDPLQLHHSIHNLIEAWKLNERQQRNIATGASDAVDKHQHASTDPELPDELKTLQQRSNKAKAKLLGEAGSGVIAGFSAIQDSTAALTDLAQLHSDAAAAAPSSSSVSDATSDESRDFARGHAMDTKMLRWLQRQYASGSKGLSPVTALTEWCFLVLQVLTAANIPNAADAERMEDVLLDTATQSSANEYARAAELDDDMVWHVRRLDGLKSRLQSRLRNLKETRDRYGCCVRRWGSYRSWFDVRWTAGDLSSADADCLLLGYI